MTLHKSATDPHTYYVRGNPSSGSFNLVEFILWLFNEGHGKYKIQNGNLIILDEKFELLLILKWLSNV